MEFKEAVKMMKDGEKVRRACWCDGSVLELKDKLGFGILSLCEAGDKDIGLSFLTDSMLEATDWEVVLDNPIKKKTLSDKIKEYRKKIMPLVHSYEHTESIIFEEVFGKDFKK